MVSFDVWSTLIKAHPEHKIKRAELLQAILCQKPVGVEQMVGILKQVEEACDRETETTGSQLGLSERIKRIYQVLPEDSRVPVLTDELIALCDRTTLTHIISYLPSLFETDLLATLAKLQKHGIKMAITSNTGYIDGRHMRVILEKLGVLGFFSIQIFSNEVGASKPNKLIFQALIEKSGLDGSVILHVGDNITADYDGALASGLKAILLSGEEDTASKKIKKIAELVE